jgi:uncharacterized membrane protein YdjX (TVP38/TMEM64 family)
LWLAVALLLLVAACGWSLFPLREWAERLNAWILGLGVWGPITFFFISVMAVISLVPTSAVTIAAGVAFGLMGFPLVLVAATIGGACAFLIARHLATDQVKHLVEDLPRSKAIYNAVSDGGWKMVFLLRLSPIMPFSVLNYVLGATELRFWPFVSASFVGIIPAVALYVYLGALGEAVIVGEAIGTVRWLLLFLGLAATLVAVFYIVRKARAELEKAALDRSEQLRRRGEIDGRA